MESAHIAIDLAHSELNHVSMLFYLALWDKLETYANFDCLLNGTYVKDSDVFVLGTTSTLNGDRSTERYYYDRDCMSITYKGKRFYRNVGSQCSYHSNLTFVTKSHRIALKECIYGYLYTRFQDECEEEYYYDSFTEQCYPMQCGLGFIFLPDKLRCYAASNEGPAGYGTGFVVGMVCMAVGLAGIVGIGLLFVLRQGKKEYTLLPTSESTESSSVL